MKLPNFTAEATLNHADNYSQIGTVGTDAGHENAVIPQALFCTSRTFGVGPLSISVKCCAVPPGCRIRACAFGLCRSFCLGACP